MAQQQVRHLHGHRRPADLDLVVAPVKLVGVARRKAQRHERLDGEVHAAALGRPAAGVSPHSVIATLISLPG